MVIAFQVILLVIIFCSFVMMFDKENGHKSQENFMFVCCITVAVFFGSAVWL